MNLVKIGNRRATVPKRITNIMRKVICRQLGLEDEWWRFPCPPGQYAFPAHLKEDPEGGWLVTFPDVPEAITGGESLWEALEQAEDALAVALLARVEKGEELSSPSMPEGQPGMVMVTVPAAKLALIDLWRRSGLSKSALARRLGVDEKVARRLLGPDHNTALSSLERAIRALGGRLVIALEEEKAL